MKKALSLVSILCALMAAHPASAQERTKTAAAGPLEWRDPAIPGPIAEAITPEAIGLAIAQSEICTELSPHFAKTGRSVAKGVLLIGLAVTAALGTIIEARHH